MLAYVYGVVPISLCRSGGCGVSTTRSGGVRIQFDEESNMPVSVTTTSSTGTGKSPNDISMMNYTVSPSIATNTLSASGSQMDGMGVGKELNSDNASTTAIASGSMVGSVCGSAVGIPYTCHPHSHRVKRSSLSSESMSNHDNLSTVTMPGSLVGGANSVVGGDQPDGDTCSTRTSKTHCSSLSSIYQIDETEPVMSPPSPPPPGQGGSASPRPTGTGRGAGVADHGVAAGSGSLRHSGKSSKGRAKTRASVKIIDPPAGGGGGVSSSSRSSKMATGVSSTAAAASSHRDHGVSFSKQQQQQLQQKGQLSDHAATGAGASVEDAAAVVVAATTTLNVPRLTEIESDRRHCGQRRAGVSSTTMPTSRVDVEVHTVVVETDPVVM